MACASISFHPPLPLCYYFTPRPSSVHQRRLSLKGRSSSSSSSSPLVLSCQNDNHPPQQHKSTSTNKEIKHKRQFSAPVFAALQKLGRVLKDNMSPQRKGDWKDLMLMSFSFAVYVYISQKIVCAYFAWTSMPTQSW